MGRARGDRASGGGAARRALNPKALLSVLAGHGVEFVVIGGFSLAAHGYVRATKDVDIVPEPSPANLARLAAALRELHAEVDLDIGADELGLEPDEEGLLAGCNWVLLTRHGRLDVMQDVLGIRDFAHLRSGAVEGRRDAVRRVRGAHQHEGRQRPRGGPPRHRRARSSAARSLTTAAVGGLSDVGHRRAPLHATSRRPALAAYLLDPEARAYLPPALDVLILWGEQIVDLIAFRTPALFPRPGLPDRIPRTDR